MFGVVKNNEILAVHDEIEIVSQYLRDRKDSEDCEVVKFNKKIKKKFENNGLFCDIYLVRYKDKYLPYKYYESIKELDADSDYDLRYCKDILFRILEEGNTSVKDSKILIKAIEIVTRELETIEIPDETLLEELKYYKDKMMNWNE